MLKCILLYGVCILRIQTFQKPSEDFSIFNTCVSSFTFKLSEENSVKITDVGVSKDAKDITGTFTGTPVYIAPEVFHSEVYDSKADIYSFGIILWEMWYGRQAFAEVRGPMTALFSLVDEGYQPGDVKGGKKPPARWKKLMSQCWDRNPDQRPSAEFCNQEITILSQAVVRPL